jgi:hypothetical protein
MKPPPLFTLTGYASIAFVVAVVALAAWYVAHGAFQ